MFDPCSKLGTKNNGSLKSGPAKTIPAIVAATPIDSSRHDLDRSKKAFHLVSPAQKLSV